MNRTRSALLVGVVAAVALLPGQAAFAASATGVTIPLTEDGERFFVFDDAVLEGDGVAVTPGSTLRVAPAPEGAAWETGADFVLLEEEEVVLELGAVADAVDSVTDGEPAESAVVLEELEALGEIAAAGDVPEGVVGGTVEADPAVDGGIRVTLDGDVPAGRYFAAFAASAPEVAVFYFLTLTVSPGSPTEVTLDYTQALATLSSFVTAADVSIPVGSRVTLSAPTGVDLREFEVEAFLPEDVDLEYPFYVADELDVSVAADGSSLTFTVPTVLPTQDDGEPATAPLRNGTPLEIYLFQVVGGDLEGPLDYTEYVITGVTATASTSTATATASTTPRIPTAVPAGGGSPESSGPGSAAVPAVALLAVLAFGGLTIAAARRGGRPSGSHR